MKTFEQLYAELQSRNAYRPEDSATVAALEAGVHSIGKKVVEEAAEEEIAQLIYHLQVLMIACGLTLDDVYARL